MHWHVIGIVAAICTTSGLIPQIVRGVRTKRLDDVSPGMFILWMVGWGLWLAYGIHLGDKIIVGANAFAYVLGITIMVLRAKYIRDRKRLSGVTETSTR